MRAKIIIIDDHPLMCKAFSDLVEGKEEFELLSAFSSIKECQDYISKIDDCESTVSTGGGYKQTRSRHAGSEHGRNIYL